MGIRIIKHGIFDTVQDSGRYGLQHLGVNPGGAADMAAYTVANMLVGNNLDDAALEMYYPAATILFEEAALIAISGADFCPAINGNPVPMNMPIAVKAGSTLNCTAVPCGCCCYVAVKGGMQVEEWAGSSSTNVNLNTDGYLGRGLRAGDVLSLKKQFNFSWPDGDLAFVKAGWHAAVGPLYAEGQVIRVCTGNDYVLLDETSKNLLVNTGFAVTPQSNRMGYRLHGLRLQKTSNEEMVSTGITKGTVQLLPNGQLVVLMAGHQATGGYPRVAHVISADMPKLAQMPPGTEIYFSLVSGEEAEQLLLAQHQYLQQLQIACNLRLEEFLHSHAHH